MPIADRDAEDGTREGQNRSDRQIDPACDDNERHTSRHEQDVGKLVGDGPQRRRGEEVVGCPAESKDEGHQDTCEAGVFRDEAARTGVPQLKKTQARHRSASPQWGSVQSLPRDQIHGRLAVGRCGS